MARMIPAFVDDHTPPGERDVFSFLAAGPEDWVVLHSLDLAPWNRGLRTEIDFVVVVPDTGILCIEVKSQRDIHFDGQRWMPDSIKRSPFKQAADGRHAFYRRLADLASLFRHVPVVHCCVFPNSKFELHPNMSVRPCELIDQRKFAGFRSAADFCHGLVSCMGKSISEDSVLRPLGRKLLPKEIEALIRFCVPIQRRNVNARSEIERRQEDLERILRDQQKPLLQLAMVNERIVVSGGAGTGKTFIALELAMRAARQGRRVALLCYNHLIGEWIKRRVERYATSPMPNLLVGRAIRIIAEMAGVSVPANPPPEYWDHVLPRELEERLTDPDFKATATVDYLVLDEAQDLLSRSALWDCLLQFLEGGLERGSFALFGDFEYQVLSGREQIIESLDILYTTSRVARFTLSENCRNYRIVANTAVLLAGIPSNIYSGYLRAGGSLDNYDIFFYDDDEQQLNSLVRFLKQFKASGYTPEEITLLSFRSDAMSAAAKLKERGYNLRPARVRGDATAFCSVHAFKGMESKIVILTDVLVTEAEFHRDLFYTGMTRATESVRVLCDRRSEKTLLTWLSGERKHE